MDKIEGFNCIKCLQCGTILVSEFRHDFKRCSCPNGSFVDGGNDYHRIGGMSFDLIKQLTYEEYLKEKAKE